MTFNRFDKSVKMQAYLLSTLLFIYSCDVFANERVYVEDLRGIWIEQRYLDALKSIKKPHAAEKISKPVLIAIRKEGRVYPYFSTDMKAAALMIVFDVEPDNIPDSYRLVLGKKNTPTSADEVTFVWFKGIRDADGQFRTLDIKEPLVMNGKWASYVRAGRELGPIINEIVLSGTYVDDQGEKWEFTDEGKATFPGKNAFYFELSLTADGADCEYIEAEDLQSETGFKYYGFDWSNNGALELFDAELLNENVQCSEEPFVTLNPM